MKTTIHNLTKHVMYQRYGDIVSICKPLRHLGIDGFIFMRHFPDGSFIDLSNQMDWSDKFLRSYFLGKHSPENSRFTGYSVL